MLCYFGSSTSCLLHLKCDGSCWYHWWCILANQLRVEKESWALGWCSVWPGQKPVLLLGFACKRTLCWWSFVIRSKENICCQVLHLGVQYLFQGSKCGWKPERGWGMAWRIRQKGRCDSSVGQGLTWLFPWQQSSVLSLGSCWLHFEFYLHSWLRRSIKGVR